jgi:hypothetical protein
MLERSEQARVNFQIHGGSGREFQDDSVVDKDAFIIGELRRIPYAVELVGAPIDSQAGPLAKPMRAGTCGIC